jgi:hypothetical protein
MPVHRRKDTTPPPLDSTQEQTAPALPEQQMFQQYVRALARAGLRMVLEGVMREPQWLSQRLLHPRPADDFWSDRGFAGAPRSRGPVPHPSL